MAIKPSGTAAAPTPIGKVHIKGIISLSPDSCIVPGIENQLTQLEMSGFSLTSCNLLMFDYLGFFWQKLLYILAAPLPLWNSPSELSERLYSRPKSSVMPQIKHLILFTSRLCILFQLTVCPSLHWGDLSVPCPSRIFLRPNKIFFHV